MLKILQFTGGAVAGQYDLFMGIVQRVEGGIDDVGREQGVLGAEHASGLKFQNQLGRRNDADVWRTGAAALAASIGAG